MSARSGKTLPIVLLLAFFSIVALAQVAELDSATPVRIVQQGGVVQLQVVATTPLRDVMTALCGKQKMQCTGTEVLSGFPVPTMTVRGSTEAVVATLMGGTEMNYRISRAASGLPLELTVLGHAPRGTEASATPALLTEQLHSRGEPTHDSEPETAEESERSERVMQMVFGGASHDAGQSTGGGANASSAGGATHGASSKPPEFLPFPDQFGNPIRTTPWVPAAYLPFPDHNGNAIPTTPQTGVQGPPIPLTPQ